MTAIPKTKPWRSKKYLEWVRSLPCRFCHSHERVEAHHVRSPGSSGVGQKPPDYMSIPCCTICHTKAQVYKIMMQTQAAEVGYMLAKAIEEGILDIKVK